MKAQSVVQKKNGRTRRGKGFSRAELRGAGLDLKEALKLGIPIDQRRRTKHEENIEALKEHLRKLSLIQGK